MFSLVVHAYTHIALDPGDSSPLEFGFLYLMLGRGRASVSCSIWEEAIFEVQNSPLKITLRTGEKVSGKTNKRGLLRLKCGLSPQKLMLKLGL
jgi:hypothetical protein